MKMRDVVLKYQNKELYDYSCSETMIIAANDFYNLNLSEDTFKMMAPFSGGMLEGETCGVITGAISVLGILFTTGVAHTSEKLYEAVLDYKTEFSKRFGSKECIQLKEFEMQQEGCTDLVVEGALLLDEIVKKYGK